MAPPQSPRRSRRLQSNTTPDEDNDKKGDSEDTSDRSSGVTKEVSMTVEESNKLRESLGLKKLTLTSQDDAPEGSSDNPRLLVEEEEGEVYNAKDAIRKRRDKRMHEELITGDTLGDKKEKEEEEESAADWVERNRHKVSSTAAAAAGASSSSSSYQAVRGEGMSVRNKRQRGIEEEKSKQQEEEEGRGGEVRLKVAHNIEDLREGETILTMRDKPILACGTDEEEDDDDEVVLEEAGGPQGLAQREKDDLWRKEKHRNAWDPTLHWDEEEGNDDLSGDNILDKYTTVEERAAIDARRRGFTLALSNDGIEQNITAELTQDVEGRLKEIMEENKRRSMMQSVAGGNIIRIQSDIMNTNEAAKFLKRRNKEARKGARLRRRRNNNKEEASASVSASGDGDDDIVIPPPKRTMDNNDDDLQDGEEDQELYRQLERQRMVEQKVKARSLVKEEPIESSSGSRDQDDDGGGIAGNNVIDLDTGASYVHDHMDTNDVKDENMGADDGDDDNDALEKQEEVDTDRDRVSRDNNGDVGRMSRASEFCASIQTPVELKQAEKDEEFAAQRAYRESRRRMLKGGTARRGIGGEGKESDEQQQDDDDDDNMELSSTEDLKESHQDYDDEEEEEFEARDEAMQDQKVDDGAACAIRYFVQRGMMSGDQDSFNSYDPGKRPMTSEEAELRIDHRDEFGRIQSAKEAFRTMSWRFHGKGPHWKNVERRVNRIQNDIKRRQETSQVAPTLRALERVQKKEGNSYMLLSGGTATGSSGSTAGPVGRG